MTVLIVTCKRCFSDFEPDRSDIMRGPAWWSLCPACRHSDADELPRVADDDKEDGYVRPNNTDD